MVIPWLLIHKGEDQSSTNRGNIIFSYETSLFSPRKYKLTLEVHLLVRSNVRRIPQSSEQRTAWMAISGSNQRAPRTPFLNEGGCLWFWWQGEHTVGTPRASQGESIRGAYCGFGANVWCFEVKNPWHMVFLWCCQKMVKILWQNILIFIEEAGGMEQTFGTGVIPVSWL